MDRGWRNAHSSTASPGPAVAATEAASASWWRGWRIMLAVVLAAVVAILAFLFRFNSLEGGLGGFENDHFATLMRSLMLLDGQQPLRDFADAELRGAWPPLSYAVPAWAQQLGGRTLLSEAYLTTGALALAHATLFLLALGFSRRWSVALVAAALAISTAPKLYNYPKVLMLAFGALAIRAVMLDPSSLRLALAAAVTGIAALFRHDYGVYVAVGLIAGLVAREGQAWRPATRQIATYLGCTALFLLPSAVSVQMYEGIPSYVSGMFASAGIETARTELRLPSWDRSALLSADTLSVFTYYAFWIVPILAAAVLVWRWFLPGTVRVTAGERATAVGLLAMAVIVNEFFLRANLSQRFGDAVVPVALLAAWSIGSASGITSRPVRQLAMVASFVLLISMLGASYVFADVARKLEMSGLLESWDEAGRRFEQVHEDLRRLPPTDWSEVEMESTLPAARYVAECTTEDDYLLVAGYAPEIYVFARRRFAAGQGTVSLSFYTSEADQRRALDRLARQSVPVVLAEAEDFEEGFVSDYPLLARYLSERYREAGAIEIEGKPRFRVFVEVGREPRRIHPHFGLPCFIS